MKKVAFYTLGCKVNQYETEAMTELFEREGYKIVNFDQFADVYVINTCTVTNLGDRKSRQMIRRAKKLNKLAIVAVTGCYAQTASEEVSQIEGVNLIIGTKDRSKIVELIDSIQEDRKQINVVQDIMNAKEFEDLRVTAYKEKTRAFLKIQEGCNQFCSYCIIPYARGPIRSRNPEDVVAEIKQLAYNGFKEVVLTGIHIASYGKDLGHTSLIDIIGKIHQVEGIERIRLGSIEPTTVTPAFIEKTQDLPKLCPHYHISLQSGCAEILQRMNRRYTTAQYRQVVKNLREKYTDAAITTDVMVGFPGETEEEFQASLQFVEEIGFSQVHVFKYSPRKGTPAATYPNHVSPQDKEARRKRMTEAAVRREREFYQKYIGKEMEVLFEQRVKDEKQSYEGLTANYIRVIVPSDDDIQGKILSVRLKEMKDGFVLGERVKQKK